MAQLPSGTVTMVFSDVEGSTKLLSRLGADYAAALDGQRAVLRRAWAAHDGLELGTEGDSFFVVFSSAPAAVAAAAQAQRQLADYPWPRNEDLRVRMGVHTGSPDVHDGGYVGMDVHRAARIAAAAHGGQVVVSDVAARLAERAGLGPGIGLRDLGVHHLKDIDAPEHLFQLEVAGLPATFPALRTLGEATTLPIPATPLVGRVGELAELSEVLTSDGVRVLTLTGPGGSGKTRLAIGVAERLASVFPDGVYFIPLAAVTATDVVWTSIAEALDLPAEGRIPPGFFQHVSHRSALLLLDNLEQIPGVATVVSELIAQAPQIVVLATSRRPLHITAEYEHPVPPLELPTDDSLTDTEAAGAVQLFLLQARRVRPGFALTVDNCAQVAAVCRRLDGLPLAIELAAARVKLLSPQALLARLDRALDLNSGQADRPVRQQTLRDTIAWSHDLLSADLQAFFRRLGVFSGGADLAAIGAVTHDVAGAVDPLEPVAELVDASLVSVNATPDGEPRVALLETVRAFSHEQLRNAGELDVTAERHARHFTLIAERLAQLFAGERHPEAFSQFETEHDNFREALAWTVRPEPGEPDRVGLGLRLASTLGAFWNTGGYFSEARRWLELVLGRWDGRASPEAAHCLHTLSQVLLVTGDLDGAYDRASLAVDVTRRLHGARPDAIRGLADIETLRGHRARARSLFEEAVALGRRGGDRRGLGRVLGAFALFEIFEGNYARSLQLETEALEIARDVGDSASALRYQHNVACTLRQTGRIDEAEQQFRELIPQVVRLRDMEHLAVLAEDYGAVLADSGKPERAVRLLGAADAMRQRLGISRDELQEAELAEPLEKTRTALLPQQWAATYENGRSLTVEDALLEHDTEPLDGAGCMPPAGERAPHRTS